MADTWNPAPMSGPMSTPMQPAMQMGPQEDGEKKRKMLASVLMNGMSGKQPDVFQMYEWSKMGG